MRIITYSVYSHHNNGGYTPPDKTNVFLNYFDALSFMMNECINILSSYQGINLYSNRAMPDNKDEILYFILTTEGAYIEYLDGEVSFKITETTQVIDDSHINNYCTEMLNNKDPLDDSSEE